MMLEMVIGSRGITSGYNLKVLSLLLAFWYRALLTEGSVTVSASP